jgi:hypothetical protein
MRTPIDTVGFEQRDEALADRRLSEELSRLRSTINSLKKMFNDERIENVRLRLELHEVTGDESWVEPLRAD